MGECLGTCKLSDYDYFLPAELIAQKPLEIRDKSRMLVLNRLNGNREHVIFDQLPGYLNKGDLLVLNNTKVIPARLYGNLAGKKTAVEMLLLYKLNSGNWAAMVKPGRKLKPGVKVTLAYGVEARIEDYVQKDLRAVSFSAPVPFEEMLPRLGKVPLPPYIKEEIDDPDQYQTIYAVKEGSAAAPTAGFHFTERVFRALEKKGVEITFITLHIGPGTFQPVKTEDIRDHVMHSEYYSIDQKAANQLKQARGEGRRIIAVGTTVCRVLETAGADHKAFKGKSEGWTDLYIYPGYEFKVVDSLLTNFHLPRSTLLMLVSALAGHEQVMAAYREAVEKGYRFYSFGDCMLII